MLREQEGEQRRLAAPGRPDDHRMADVADMKIQPERRRAGRRRVRERRTLGRIERAWVLRETRPDAREWQASRRG